MTTLALQTLRSIRNLLTNPGGWIKFYDSAPLDPETSRPRSFDRFADYQTDQRQGLLANHECHCLRGAAMRASQTPEQFAQAMFELSRSIKTRYPQFAPGLLATVDDVETLSAIVIGWNDDLGRLHSEVIQIVDDSIERLA